MRARCRFIRAAEFGQILFANAWLHMKKGGLTAAPEAENLA